MISSEPNVVTENGNPFRTIQMDGFQHILRQVTYNKHNKINIFCLLNIIYISNKDTDTHVKTHAKIKMTISVYHM